MTDQPTPEPVHGDQVIAISADQIQAVRIAPAPVIAIRDEHGRLQVAIHPDGRLEYGPDYQPDEAARTFWEAVQRFTPSLGDREFGPQLHARVNAELKAGQEAQRKVERLDQMATAWLEQLPDTIRTATAAEAVHQVTRREG